MNCKQTQEYLNELDFAGGTGQPLSKEISAHLESCPACRDEYRIIQEARDLFTDLTPVEPVPSFGPGWRNRLREVQLEDQKNKSRRFSFSLGWPRLVPAFGLAVAVFLIGFAISNHGWITPNNPGINGQGNVVQSSGTFRLKIVTVGPQNKLVQRVIREFRSAYEGGAAYTYRDPENDLTTFKGLTWKQAQTLKRNLEKAGAVVNLIHEK